MSAAVPPDDGHAERMKALQAELCECADLVSEMRDVKHPFAAGIKAQRGIDF